VKNMGKCAICGCKTGFNKTWTEEDAKKETQELLKLGEMLDPNLSEEDKQTEDICDDCFKMVMHQIPPTHKFLELIQIWQQNDRRP
jgi:hypothetical protein